MCSKHAVNNKPTRKIPFSKEHETEGEVQESRKELSTTKKLILSLVLLLSTTVDVILERSYTMNVFLQALLCAFLVKAIANSTVATKSDTDARKPQCNVNNCFYAGPNTKKIEQQLAEIREEIKALKENRTSGGASSDKGISLNSPFSVF